MASIDRSDWRSVYIDKYYVSKPGWKHPYDQWCELVETCLTEKSTVLEIGGGPTLGLTRRLRPWAQRLIGLDVDPVIRNNDVLDLPIVYDGSDFLGIQDNQIDVAVADWVNEHITNPAKHFGEVGRVLRPGGLYVFRTVNLYHYKALGAKLVPHRLQAPLARWLRHTPKEDYDPYKVYYRANTRRRIEDLCAQAGLEIVSYCTLESGVSYGLGARPLFFLFMAYERLVNASPLFTPLRHTIHCVARKKCGAVAADAKP
jgi:SAM-dependent methyltransferase